MSSIRRDPGFAQAGDPVEILISGLGARGGGVARWDGGTVEVLDDISTTGLHACGGLVARSIYTDGVTGPARMAEVAVYDERGLLRYARIDEAEDVHDVMLRGDGTMIVVSTGNNRVLWCDASGRVERQWAPGGRSDSWHLNCLATRGERLYVSAFGRGQGHRSWLGDDQSGGVLLDLESGDVVLDGLSRPHSPIWTDGFWAIANSERGEVLFFSDGTVQRRLNANGWTRGICVVDGLIVVATSAARDGGSDAGYAHVAVFDRVTLAEVARVPLPWTEIYDVTPVAPRLAAGVARGCNTNPLRAAESRRRRLDRGETPFDAGSAGGADAPLLAEVEMPVPPVAAAGQAFDVECTIRNVGEQQIDSEPPDPMLLTYKCMKDGAWAMRTKSHPVESLRSRIPRTIPPRGERAVTVRIEMPNAPGEYEFVPSLYSGQYGWIECGASVPVKVVAAIASEAADAASVAR